MKKLRVSMWHDNIELLKYVYSCENVGMKSIDDRYSKAVDIMWTLRTSKP